MIDFVNGPSQGDAAVSAQRRIVQPRGPIRRHIKRARIRKEKVRENKSAKESDRLEELLFTRLDLAGEIHVIRDDALAVGVNYAAIDEIHQRLPRRAKFSETRRQKPR